MSFGLNLQDADRRFQNLVVRDTLATSNLSAKSIFAQSANVGSISATSAFIENLETSNLVSFMNPLTISGFNITLTPAEIINTAIFRTGPGNSTDAPSTDTLPTAANLLTNLSGASVGTSFSFLVANGPVFSITIAAGTGGTVISGNPVIPTGSTSQITVIFTSVSSSSPSYNVYVV